MLVAYIVNNCQDRVVVVVQRARFTISLKCVALLARLLAAVVRFLSFFIALERYGGLKTQANHRTDDVCC